eukprot:02299.XXX_59443_60838_1 [CDS] Oithona nana genome sequencing.
MSTQLPLIPWKNMADQVSFKVTLREDVSDETKSKSQVRRFVVPQDCSTSLVYLKEKLRSIFGSTLGTFRLSWKDEDEDDVIIETDEELMIGLQEMKGPLYKLDVVSLGAPDNAKIPAEQQPTPQGPQEEHFGVTCDGCQGPVIGFRYKCVKCPDYDLCGKCEAKGFHPGHNMMRIATPETIWPKHFFNRLNKMNDRLNKMHERAASKDKEAKEAETTKENEEGNKTSSPENSNSGSWNSWGSRRHGHGWGSGCGRGGPWGRRAASAGPQRPDLKNFLGPLGLDPNAFKHMESEMNANGANLLDLGNMVRAALDPFGVDVHVDIETPQGEKKCVNKKKSCGDKAKTPEKTPEPTEKVLNQLRRLLSNQLNQLKRLLRNQLNQLRRFLRNQLSQLLSKFLRRSLRNQPMLLNPPKLQHLMKNGPFWTKLVALNPKELKHCIPNSKRRKRNPLMSHLCLPKFK